MTVRRKSQDAGRDLLKKASADLPTLLAGTDLGDAARKVVKAVGCSPSRL